MLPESARTGHCELCDREPIKVTRHHLTPLSEGGRGGPFADLCASCHRQLHALFTNEELRALNSIDRLRDHPAVQKYLGWVRRQPPQTGVRVHRRRS